MPKQNHKTAVNHESRGCISPSGCIENNGGVEESADFKWVDVECSADMCPENHRIHENCFEKWLQELLDRLEGDRGLHTRNHTIGKGKYLDRLVWTTNIYRHVFHLCKCPCGGYLKLAEKFELKPEKIPPPKVKPKQLPTLNQASKFKSLKTTRTHPIPAYAVAKADTDDSKISSLYASVDKNYVPVGMSVVVQKKSKPRKLKNRSPKSISSSRSESICEEENDGEEEEQEEGEEEWQEIAKKGKKVAKPVSISKRSVGKPMKSSLTSESSQLERVSKDLRSLEDGNSGVSPHSVPSVPVEQWSEECASKNMSSFSLYRFSSSPLSKVGKDYMDLEDFLPDITGLSLGRRSPCVKTRKLLESQYSDVFVSHDYHATTILFSKLAGVSTGIL